MIASSHESDRPCTQVRRDSDNSERSAQVGSPLWVLK